MFWIILLFTSMYADNADKSNTQIDQNTSKDNLIKMKRYIRKSKAQRDADEMQNLIHSNPLQAANVYISKWLATLDNMYLDKAIDIYIGKQLIQDGQHAIQSLQLLKDISFNQGRLIFSWARLLYEQGQNNYDVKALTDSRETFLSFIRVAGEENLDQLTSAYIEKVMLSIDNILSSSDFSQIVHLYNNHRDEIIVIIKHCEEFLKKYGHSEHADKVKEIQKDMQIILSKYIAANKI